MVTSPQPTQPRPAWFVGAAYNRTDDQTDRFLADGIWEHNNEDEYIEQVRSVLPGDRIAIKSTYTRSLRQGLPFDNRGHTVSVMRIKATGVVTENAGDGRNLKVEWTRVESLREWYFFTNQSTVWEVWPVDWPRDSLIEFTFDGKPQDICRFRNDPYWKERFGDAPNGGQEQDDDNQAQDDDNDVHHLENLDNRITEALDPYTIDDIMADGCFLDRSKLETALGRLRAKKNLILQGPPGTGKTWLGKKLAFALIGSKAEHNVHRFQFHPNLSYEDFIRGWRPEAGGRLDLVDGPFLKVIARAKQEPDSSHVFVIEEVNRGNPAQIFGEMLTLLEADKRRPEEALALGYSRNADERVYIPPNVYIIGTMNVADRSIALVDLALRRRFAFVDLEPTFGESWRQWVSANCNVDAGFLGQVESRIQALNQAISIDATLGPQFRVGHSFVTPEPRTTVDAQWFRQVVETDIGPLLGEYWFDALDKVKQQTDKLIDGLP